MFHKATSFRTLAFVIITLTLLFYAPTAIERQLKMGLDFPIFYAAAQNRGEADGYIYPPFLAWVLYPLTFLELPLASTLWYIIQSVIFLIALRYCIPSIDWKDPFRIIAASIFLVAVLRLVILNAELGQVNGLVLVLTLVALRTEKPYLIGFFLGLATAIKIAPILFLPFVLMDATKKRKSILAMFGLVLVISIVLPYLSGFSFFGLSALREASKSPISNFSLLEFTGGAYLYVALTLVTLSVLVAIRTSRKHESPLIAVSLLMLIPPMVRKAHLLWGLLFGQFLSSTQKRVVAIPLFWALSSLFTMVSAILAFIANCLVLVLLLYNIWLSS